METVEVVIRIPKKQLERLQRIANGTWGLMNLNSDEIAILNGIVLPKGHGKLIDADYLREDFKVSKKISFAERMNISCIVDHAPTIIEVDEDGE